MSPEQNIGGEVIREALVERTVFQAAAIERLDRGMEEASNPRPSPENGVTPSPNRALAKTLDSFRAAVIEGDQEKIRVSSDLGEQGVKVVAEMLMAVGKSDEEIGVMVGDDQQALALSHLEKAKRFTNVGRAARDTCRIVEKLDWSSGREPGFPELSGPEVSLLINHVTQIDKNVSTPIFTLLKVYDRQIKEWLRQGLGDGTAEAYKMMSFIADQVNIAKKYGTYNPDELEPWKNHPGKNLGKKLQLAREYAPEVFSMPQERLGLLLGKNFEIDEIYDIACNPLLQQRMFEITPDEWDDTVPPGMQEDHPVNLQVYLDYLIKTGGCFGVADTQVLNKLVYYLRNDSDGRESVLSPWQNANMTWYEWRTPKGRHNAREVLRAWNVAELDDILTN